MSTNGVAVLDVDPLQPLPTQEELACYVESKTYRQIQDLKIDCHGSSVKVTGRKAERITSSNWQPRQF